MECYMVTCTMVFLYKSKELFLSHMKYRISKNYSFVLSILSCSLPVLCEIQKCILKLSIYLQIFRMSHFKTDIYNIFYSSLLKSYTQFRSIAYIHTFFLYFQCYSAKLLLELLLYFCIFKFDFTIN